MNTVPSSFWQWFSTLHGDEMAGVVLAIAVMIVAVIAIVCTTIYKIHKTRTEDTLKRELLDRGMSAEEIATVIAAKSEKKFLPPGWKSE